MNSWIARRFSLGIVVVCCLVVMACEAGDLKVAPVNERPSSPAQELSATPTTSAEPTSTPIPEPTSTPQPSPTPGPRPGRDRSTAPLIALEQITSGSFRFFGGSHFYEVLFEEGVTYAIDVTTGLTVVLTDSVTEALAFRSSGEDSAQILLWTAPVSGSYFVIVNGDGGDKYTLTVTEATLAGSTALIETATADIPSRPMPSPSPSAAPPSPATPLTFASVTGGFNHTCGVTTDGAAYCWGWNHFGQLGDGMKNNQHHPLPLAVAGGHVFASVSAGFNFTCGITTNGLAYCWGSGGAGQIGDGFRSDQPAPVAVSNGLEFTSISAGNEHTCGVTIDGAAYCWGTDNFGQLGTGSITQQTTPVAVAGKLAFASISAGTDHTCGITTDRAAYCWGVRGNGKLGSGPKDDFDFDLTQETPVAVLGGLEFVSVSAGAEHTCGVAVDGSAYCWGGVGLGRLGDGFTTGQMELNDGQDRFRTTPTVVLGELVFATVSSGAEHTCGVTVDGAAYCWGTGFNGALGDGLSADQAKPIAVSGGLVFASVIAGYDHTCGVATNGTAYCWGSPAGLGSGRVPPPEFLKPAVIGPPVAE